jgi:hypothetical protein
LSHKSKPKSPIAMFSVSSRDPINVHLTTVALHIVHWPFSIHINSTYHTWRLIYAKSLSKYFTKMVCTIWDFILRQKLKCVNSHAPRMSTLRTPPFQSLVKSIILHRVKPHAPPLVLPHPLISEGILLHLALNLHMKDQKLNLGNRVFLSRFTYSAS